MMQLVLVLAGAAGVHLLLLLLLCVCLRVSAFDTCMYMFLPKSVAVKSVSEPVTPHAFKYQVPGIN